MQVVDRFREFGIAESWRALETDALERWIEERLERMRGSLAAQWVQIDRCVALIDHGLEWKDAFAGRTVLVVGGSPRHERLRAFEEHFGGAFEWQGNERTERTPLAALEQRIAHGRYHVVLSLARFSSHALQDA